MIKHKFITTMAAAFFLASISVYPRLVSAQQTSEDNGVFVFGSVLLSILHLPVKLVTCVGTQATAAVAYTATFGVPGGYDGGTNGKDIGETARRSCTGSWLIAPSQVKNDYGS